MLGLKPCDPPGGGVKCDPWQRRPASALWAWGHTIHGQSQWTRGFEDNHSHSMWQDKVPCSIHTKLPDKKKKSHIKNKNKTPLEACRYQLMLMIINRTQFCSETLQLIPSDLTKGFCREMKHAKSNDSIHSPELLCTTFTLFSKHSECAPANYQLHNSQFSNPVHLTRLCYIILHVWQLIPRRNFSLNLQ